MPTDPVPAAQALFIPERPRIALEARRITQILVAVLIGLAVVTVPFLITRNWFPAGVLAVTAGFLLFALREVRRKHLQCASWLLLVSLTTAVCVLIAAGKGLLDEAILTLPGLLIFTSMFGSRRLYIGVLVALGNVLAMVAASHFLGWRGPVSNLVRPDTYITIMVILGLSAYYIWLITSALRNTMTSLETENGRVRTSLAQIEVLAHHDGLTGLPNRLLARDRFDQAALHATRNHCKAALLFLDLDNFKTVNDSLGHVGGDALLCEVAARLVKAMRANDTVSRQGGDEFLIVLNDLTDADAAAASATKLVEQLGLPYQIGGYEVSATCSLGIALYPDNGDNFDTLLKHADRAMYQAKDSGRNNYHFFDDAMHANVAQHMQLISAMRAALTNKEFTLAYQPQFSLKDQRVVGAEALLRWTHPTLGNVSPATFIPLAESSGLIVEIGAWVLHEACRQAKAWQLAGLTDLQVAVNVAPVQFRREGIEQEILKALEAAELAPSSIELELTESLLVADAVALSDMLGRLRAVGLRFSIDDFGTGYSNLGYLKRFKVERLKIDQSFVRRMNTDADDEGIVRAIIQMSHSLKLEAVAEGIEDAVTLKRLTEMGCDFGQGFHWSPALPPDEFLRFVRMRA